MADLTAWRALVDKELAGASFDKLVQRTAEGIAIEPLYVEAPTATRPLGGAKFRICMRARPREAAEHIEGGAEALWLDGDDFEAMKLADARGIHVIDDYDTTGSDAPIDDDDDDEDDGDGARPAHPRWLSFDPIVQALAIGPRILAHDSYVRSLVPPTADLGDDLTRCARISTLPYHAMGADAADELAIALSTAAAYLRVLIEGDLARERAAAQLWFQISVGRDTFGELCKLRALRVLAGKLFAASNITAELPPIHAVSSSRTQAARDPWVNLLRVTTEVFAAAIGGADLITPLPFDTELAEPSALGRRVARNTALVLRDESHLGRVIDAAGGSYYIESRTDALAREAWRRFREIEAGGGIAKLIATGAMQTRLAASWATRAQAIAKRKEPILGVSEFANPGEQLPSPPSGESHGHRDAEAFEALRAKLGGQPLDVMLVQLGTAAEARARTSFAKQLFATAGIVAREASVAEALGGVPNVACLCGSDESYAQHAASLAAELRDAGSMKIALAGKPNQTAGVDTYIYMGCDVVAAISELLP